MASKEESDFVFKHGPFVGQRVIEVGSSVDYSKTYRTEMKAKEYVGVDMRPYKYTDIVHNLHEPLDIPPADTLLLVSVLEHCPKPWLLAPNVTNLVKQGGLILITVPFVWRVHDHPSDYWRFTPEAIELLFPDFTWITKDTHPPGHRLDKHTTVPHVQLYFAGRKR